MKSNEYRVGSRMCVSAREHFCNISFRYMKSADFFSRLADRRKNYIHRNCVIFLGKFFSVSAQMSNNEKLFLCVFSSSSHYYSILRLACLVLIDYYCFFRSSFVHFHSIAGGKERVMHKSAVNNTIAFRLEYTDAGLKNWLKSATKFLVGSRQLILEGMICLPFLTISFITVIILNRFSCQSWFGN